MNMEKTKPILGAIVVAGAVLVPTMYGIYSVDKDNKQNQIREAEDRAMIQQLKESPTPTVTATPSASPTPTKKFILSPTVLYKVSPVIRH